MSRIWGIVAVFGLNLGLISGQCYEPQAEPVKDVVRHPSGLVLEIRRPLLWIEVGEEIKIIADLTYVSHLADHHVKELVFELGHAEFERREEAQRHILAWLRCMPPGDAKKRVEELAVAEEDEERIARMFRILGDMDKEPASAIPMANPRWGIDLEACPEDEKPYRVYPEPLGGPFLASFSLWDGSCQRRSMDVFTEIPPGEYRVRVCVWDGNDRIASQLEVHSPWYVMRVRPRGRKAGGLWEELPKCWTISQEFKRINPYDSAASGNPPGWCFNGPLDLESLTTRSVSIDWPISRARLVNLDSWSKPTEERDGFLFMEHAFIYQLPMDYEGLPLKEEGDQPAVLLGTTGEGRWFLQKSGAEDALLLEALVTWCRNRSAKPLQATRSEHDISVLLGRNDLSAEDFCGLLIQTRKVSQMNYERLLDHGLTREVCGRQARAMAPFLANAFVTNAHYQPAWIAEQFMVRFQSEFKAEFIRALSHADASVRKRILWVIRSALSSDRSVLRDDLAIHEALTKGMVNDPVLPPAAYVMSLVRQPNLAGWLVPLLARYAIQSNLSESEGSYAAAWYFLAEQLNSDPTWEKVCARMINEGQRDCIKIWWEEFGSKREWPSHDRADEVWGRLAKASIRVSTSNR